MGGAEPPRLPTAHGFGPLRGLKARMAFILGVVLVPALIYSCWQAFVAYGDRRAQRDAMVASTLKVVAGYAGEFFERTRALLVQLATEPDIREARLPGCVVRLVEARNRNPDYLSFVLLDREGTVLCSSAPEPRMAMGARDFFQQLQAGDSLAVSGLIPRRTGPGETIVVAVPLRAPGTGEFAGAIAAAVNLEKLQRAIRVIDLPHGGVAYLVDRDAQLLAEPAAGVDATSAPPGRELLTQLLVEPQQALTVRGDDSVQRDFNIIEIASGLFVVAGVPSMPRFAWVQRELLIGVFAPTLMLGLAVTTIWIASDYMVIRHVRTLAVAARAYSRGELDLRLNFASAPVEFQELAETLARMAGQVHKREEELRTSLAQKDLLLREVHHRVKNNLQILTSLLNLRAQRLQAPVARDAVREAQMRIAAMTLVHRRLYQTDDIREIELAGFLEELCTMLEEVNETSQGVIEVAATAEPIRISPDQAIPLALLITEAISNAFKHPCPEGAEQRFQVRLEHVDGKARLVIVAGGQALTGTDGEFAGVGATLMHMLAKQIGGTLHLTAGARTQLECSIPVVGGAASPPGSDAGRDAPAAASSGPLARPPEELAPAAVGSGPHRAAASPGAAG